jgi:hypothetical protein
VAGTLGVPSGCSARLAQEGEARQKQSLLTNVTSHSPRPSVGLLFVLLNYTYSCVVVLVSALPQRTTRLLFRRRFALLRDGFSDDIRSVASREAADQERRGTWIYLEVVHGAIIFAGRFCSSTRAGTFSFERSGIKPSIFSLLLLFSFQIIFGLGNARDSKNMLPEPSS